jgi:hypothetical protein
VTTQAMTTTGMTTSSNKRRAFGRIGRSLLVPGYPRPADHSGTCRYQKVMIDPTSPERRMTGCPARS